MDDCALRNSIYFKPNECLVCQTKVLNLSNICSDYCYD